MTTFIWLWAYSLKTPISIICALSLAGCFLSWLSAKSQRGEVNMTAFNIGAGIAIFWAFIYAIPSPTYDVRTVIKEVPKPYPVVRTIRYVAQKQTLTRTITQQYGEDHMFQYCIDNSREATDIDLMNKCKTFARQYVEPRIVTKEVKVPVPSGIQIKLQHDPYADLFKQCNEIGAINDNDKANGGGTGAQLRNERIQECTEYALKGSKDH